MKQEIMDPTSEKFFDIVREYQDQIDIGNDFYLIGPRAQMLVKACWLNLEEFRQKELIEKVRRDWKNRVADEFGWGESRFKGKQPSEIEEDIKSYCLLSNNPILREKKDRIPSFLIQYRRAIIVEYGKQVGIVNF